MRKVSRISSRAYFLQYLRKYALEDKYKINESTKNQRLEGESLEQWEYSCLDQAVHQMLLVPCSNHFGITNPISTHTTCYLPQASVTLCPRAFSGRRSMPGLSRARAGRFEEFMLVSRTGQKCSASIPRFSRSSRGGNSRAGSPQSSRLPAEGNTEYLLVAFSSVLLSHSPTVFLGSHANKLLVPNPHLMACFWENPQ